VRVEQVGGAVQADGGLAGARGALHADRLGQRSADDLVLLGLDGGDDVAHGAAAGALDLGPEQRAVALLPRAEELVLVAGELAAGEPEPAAADQALRIAGAGPVERPAHGRPPVDDHRGAGAVADVPAADVEGLGRAVGGAGGGGGVGAAEEGRDAGVGGQGAQPLGAGGTEPLGGPGVDTGVDDGGGGGAHPGEAVVCEGQVRALGSEDGVGRGGGGGRVGRCR
jgi:hypothetical protein